MFQSVEHKLPSFLYSRNSKLSQVLAVAEGCAQISYRHGSFHMVPDTKLISPERLLVAQRRVFSMLAGKLGSRGGNEGKRRADEFY